jgi:hypothetical protein
MRLALWPLVPFRTRVARVIGAMLIVFTALVGVGITAPAEAPFSIAIRPVLMNLGVDIDIKVWTLHLHYAWSALPAPASTKPDAPAI